MEKGKINWMAILIGVAISVVVSVAIMHFTKIVDKNGVDTSNKLKLVA